MMRKTKGTIAITGVLALTLAGCGGGDGGSDSDGGTSGSSEVEQADYNPQPRENLQQGGSATFPISEIPEQMNPNHAQGSANTSRIWTWYNPQMVLMSPEGEAKPNPAYLEDITTEVVDGKTVVTYTINPDAQWNDGTPMTWVSYENAWKAQSGENEEYQPSSTDGYSKIESVEQGEDERQAVVTFETEYPWTEGLFWNLMHPEIDTPEKFNNAYIEEPNPEYGAGPYKVDSFDANGGTLTFVPNDGWWGDAPMLDQVVFRQLEPTASINAFKSGEVDMTGTGTKDRLAQVEDMEGVTTYRSVAPQNNLFTINATRDKFSDLEVRKAMMMGIDREQLKQVAFDGLDYEEEPAGSFNLYPFQEGYVNAFEDAGLEHNPEEASSLLEEAGWTEGEDGIRSKDGTRLTATLPLFGDDPVAKTRARAMQQQMKEIGVEVEIDPRAAADFSEDYTGQNWDIFTLRFTSSDPYGVAYMCQVYCTGSGLNLSGTGSEELDEQIEEVQTLPTAEEQISEGMDLESEVVEKTWGIMPLYNGPSIMTAKDGLANLTPEPYTGLDLFGVTPVEDVGWEKDSAGASETGSEES